jgi:transposase InsO family protein
MEISVSEPRSLGLLCGLFGYTRQAYYGQFREAEKGAASAYLVLAEVVRIRKVQKRIGGRKLHHMLAGFMEEHSLMMGRDGFFDLLREHQMLVRRRRSRKPRTTYSGYWMKRHPNLAKEFIPVAANQLWVSDITYVRVGDGFAYLSLVTDAYSRKIVGFCLSRDLTARGCVEALRMGFAANRETDGLIHHSDRGLQYYSSRYMKLLKRHSVRVSMSEKSDPLENAIAERVNGILKDELLEKRFESFAQAHREVAEAVSIYNNLRPHLSIDMLTPAEAHSMQHGSLKRRWKNYYASKRPRFTVQASA